MVVLPDVDDVLDDDRECGDGTQGHTQVRHDRVWDNVGDQETASGATDADAKVAEGVVEVVHLRNFKVQTTPSQRQKYRMLMWMKL